jgi:malonyl-CoA O-methyltransferase
MSNVVKEFSRFAHKYNQYNSIQSKVAKRLISRIPKHHYSKILDLGCGSGAVYENLKESNILFDELTVFDSSSNMLEVHPNEKSISKICGNFNNENFLSLLPHSNYNILFSSSAIQWSKDLDFTLSSISSLSTKAYFSIFTSGTFSTLHKIANITSPIHSADTLLKEISKHYTVCNSEIHTYTLHFDSVLDMFRYIKKSGVSSGEKKLSYKDTKRLMKSYPLDYLEFEVLFVEAEM